jgi:hypothetical protein
MGDCFEEDTDYAKTIEWLNNCSIILSLILIAIVSVYTTIYLFSCKKREERPILSCGRCCSSTFTGCYLFLEIVTHL